MDKIIVDNYYALYIYLDAFWRRRYLIIMCILITPFFALFSAKLLPKIYKASISIAINKIETPTLKDVSSSVDISQEFAGFKAYISSPSALKKAIIKAQLVPANASDKVIEQTTDDLSKNLTVTLVGQNVMQIDLIQNNPNYISSILNTLGDILINQLNTQGLETTRSSLEVLKNNLKNQKKIINKTTDTLNHYKETHADLLPEYGDIYLARLREINSELGEAQVKHNALIVQQKELYSMIIKMNPQVGQIENAIRENDRNLSSMRIVYTDNFPGVKALIQRGESLRTERDQLYKQYQNVDENTIRELWNMVIAPTNNASIAPSQSLTLQLEKLSEMQLKIKGMAQQEGDLANQQKEINTKLRLIGTTNKILSKLNQRIKNNQNLYDELFSRYNLLKMTANLSTTNKYRNAQIVAYPQKPTQSLARPPFAFFILGFFSGILLGFGLAIIFEFLDNTVRKRRDLETISDLTVICRVEKINLA